MAGPEDPQVQVLHRRHVGRDLRGRREHRHGQRLGEPAHRRREHRQPGHRHAARQLRAVHRASAGSGVEHSTSAYFATINVPNKSQDWDLILLGVTDPPTVAQPVRGAVTESDETNNSLVHTCRVYGPTPDTSVAPATEGAGDAWLSADRVARSIRVDGRRSHVRAGLQLRAAGHESRCSSCKTACWPCAAASAAPSSTR